MKVLAPGEFSAAASIPLPVGSVLVLNGNGADVAKHCVPAVPTKRISITFRKMDASKVPFGFRPDPLLQSLAAAEVRPVMTAASAPPNRAAWEQRQGEAAKHATPQQQHQRQAAAPLYQEAAAVRAGQAQSPGGGVPFILSTDEFPALGASPASGRRQGKR
uniref:Fe2OG dioxygenase domain-containing protein n=1 Tax=Hordeum vulgare subsp. vulgare TaxID=112509 RepID=A0A8I6YRR7_HORVV